jgi:hypothetical protein
MAAGRTDREGLVRVRGMRGPERCVSGAGSESGIYLEHRRNIVWNGHGFGVLIRPMEAIDNDRR